MTALALLVICLGLLMLAGRGLASGAQGDLLGVRFGGDGQRTRVVIDLERATQGRVIEDGTQGQVILSLLEVAAGRGASGEGSGLVRSYRVGAQGGASRVQLDLARNGEIERRFLLPPGDGVGHYRYVIDVKAKGAGSTFGAPAAHTSAKAPSPWRPPSSSRLNWKRPAATACA